VDADDQVMSPTITEQNSFSAETRNNETTVEISSWIERLAGIPKVLDLPKDRPRLPVQRAGRACQRLMLSDSLSESLRELSESEGISLFVILLAAFKTLLLRYTGQDDIVVGSILQDHDSVETQSLNGCNGNTVVIRTDLGGDPTFRELLHRVNDSERWARDHQSVSLEDLTNALQPKRDPSHNALFQVLVSMAPSFSLESDWEAANSKASNGAANLDLQLLLVDGPAGIATSLIFDTDLFDAVTIARMAGHFQTLLQGVVADPEQLLSKLPLLSEAERRDLLVEWNNTLADYPRLCLHQLFEAQAERTPDANALAFEHESLTYGELNKRAN